MNRRLFGGDSCQSHYDGHDDPHCDEHRNMCCPQRATQMGSNRSIARCAAGQSGGTGGLRVGQHSKHYPGQEEAVADHGKRGQQVGPICLVRGLGRGRRFDGSRDVAVCSGNAIPDIPSDNRPHCEQAACQYSYVHHVHVDHRAGRSAARCLLAQLRHAHRSQKHDSNNDNVIRGVLDGPHCLCASSEGPRRLIVKQEDLTRRSTIGQFVKSEQAASREADVWPKNTPVRAGVSEADA